MSRENDRRRIEEIHQRLDAASNGTWEAWIEGGDQLGGDTFIRTGDKDLYLHGVPEFRVPVADYDFIANAKEDIEFLLAEITDLSLQKQRISEISRRFQEARAGTWEVMMDNSNGKKYIAMGKGQLHLTTYADSFVSDVDLQFIAHARADIEFLLELIQKGIV